MAEHKTDNVCAHLQGLNVFFHRVVVDADVFPTIAKVALVAEEAYQSAIDEQPEALRRQIVVLMDFWKSVIELIYSVVNGVAERQFNELLVRENLFHLAAHKLLNSVVVVDVQKSARRQIMAQVHHVGIRKNNVAVACQMHKWVVEKVGAANIDSGRFRIDVCADILVAVLNQIWQRCGVGVPVAAAVVFEQGNAYLLCLQAGGGAGNQNDGQYRKMCFSHYSCFRRLMVWQAAIPAVSVRSRQGPR